jgi:predicted nucleic acid-binding protein
MVSILVDTSGLYAVLDSKSVEHRAASEEWARILEDSAFVLRTHSYVLLETAALVQARLGMQATATLHRDVVPALSIRWVDRPLHTQAMTSLLAADRRKVSLVDWTSFEMMRDEHLSEAFAFDPHFAEQGFTLRPRHGPGAPSRRR